MIKFIFDHSKAIYRLTNTLYIEKQWWIFHPQILIRPHYDSGPCPAQEPWCCQVGRRPSPWQGYIAMLMSLRKAGEALSYFKVRLKTVLNKCMLCTETRMTFKSYQMAGSVSFYVHRVHLGKVKGTVLQIVESGPVKSADGSTAWEFTEKVLH